MVHKALFYSFFLLTFLPATAQKTCPPQSLQTTLALIKPDAVASGKSGEIITIIELNGFTIERMEKRLLEVKQVEQFYREHRDKPFFRTLIDYITSNPVIVLALSKDNAITEWRTLMGSTNPEDASVGTLRRMFGIDKTHNAVHGSDSPQSAQRELQLFWDKKN